MDSATTTDVISTARRVGLVLTVGSCLALSGCARLRSFLDHDRPVFGTEPASDNRSGAGLSAPGDLYTERLARSKATDPARSPRSNGGPAEGLVASRTSNEPDAMANPGALAAETNPAARAEDPKIALGAPVALRPLSGPDGTSDPNRTRPATGQEDAPTLAPPTVALDGGRSGGPTLGSVLAESRRRLDALSSYQVKMNHQERVGDTLNPAEDVILSIRRNPRAVRLEWTEGPHKGREVLYAADGKDALMHVRMGGPLSAVPRLSMAPDSPLALRNSRHPITEAGFDTILQRMEEGARQQSSRVPNADRIVYAGRETPEGYGKPCHKVVRLTSEGETWTVYLDVETQFPALVQAISPRGEVLERYLFRDPTFNPPELASSVAFDPDARWGASKGLLQRLARSNDPEPKPDAPKSR
jgi:hypothetical protein